MCVCVCVCVSLNQVFCGPRTEDLAFSEIYMIWEFDSLDNFLNKHLITVKKNKKPQSKTTKGGKRPVLQKL